jgi:hypothetical protein
LKIDFSPWSLGGQKPCGEDEGGGSTEDKNPREDVSLTLEHLGHPRGRLGGGGTGHGGGRREIERSQWFRGLNTLGPTPS